MHDWTLLSIRVEWEAGRAELIFSAHLRDSVPLVAEGVAELHMPRRYGWGPSVSVNKVKGPSVVDGGLQTLEIEMQSGDCIRIVAASFQMPAGI
jgi:hypothetical protein